MKWSLAIGILFLQGGLAQLENGQGNIDDYDNGCTFLEAEDCFGDVQDDLRVIFDPNNNYAQTTNVTLLRDLCSAWDDSLDCTLASIDENCQDSDGKLKFDHWNAALRKTFEFVCSDEDLRLLRNVFHSVRCFNISAFLYCVERTAQLRSVKDLLSSSLNLMECRYIQKVVAKCGEYVSYGTCAREVMEPVNSILDAFLQASECSSLIQAKPLVDSSGSVKYENMLVSSLLISLTAVSSFFFMSEI